MDVNIIRFVTLSLLQCRRVTGAESVPVVGTTSCKQLQSLCFPWDALGHGQGAVLSCGSILSPAGRARAGDAVLVVGQGFGDSPAPGAAVSAVPVQG